MRQLASMLTVFWRVGGFMCFILFLIVCIVLLAACIVLPLTLTVAVVVVDIFAIDVVRIAF